MSVGSGVEHAEGGGTPAGVRSHGFQIWINVPRTRKYDDPRYGTAVPETMVDISLPCGGNCRLLAGAIEDKIGPFQTTQDVLMLDLELPASAEHVQSIPCNLDNCLIYVYRGEVSVAGERVREQEAARFNA